MMSRAPGSHAVHPLVSHLDLTSVHVWFCVNCPAMPMFRNPSLRSFPMRNERVRPDFAFEGSSTLRALAWSIAAAAGPLYAHKSGEIQFITGGMETGSGRSISPVREHSV